MLIICACVRMYSPPSRFASYPGHSFSAVHCYALLYIFVHCYAKRCIVVHFYALLCRWNASWKLSARQHWRNGNAQRKLFARKRRSSRRWKNRGSTRLASVSFICLLVCRPCGASNTCLRKLATSAW